MQGGTKGQLDIGDLMRKRGSRRLQLAAGPTGRGEGRDLRPRRRVGLADDRVRRDRAAHPDETFPFAEAAAAHARLESGDHLGKIILTA